MTDYEATMALRAPVAKALKKFACHNCEFFKSEHGPGTGCCPESGRMMTFKPGGYVDLPDEVWDVILNPPKPQRPKELDPGDSMAVYGNLTIGDSSVPGGSPPRSGKRQY